MATAHPTPPVEPAPTGRPGDEAALTLLAFGIGGGGTIVLVLLAWLLG